NPSLLYIAPLGLNLIINRTNPHRSFHELCPMNHSPSCHAAVAPRISPLQGLVNFKPVFNRWVETHRCYISPRWG
ncbi:MAG TPA: hypothetical protein VHB48_13460, partial [Chitinophagaceae bacterium]|nr:hypothetical protein [Chitinophagaceae bacterium]